MSEIGTCKLLKPVKMLGNYKKLKVEKNLDALEDWQDKFFFSNERRGKKRIINFADAFQQDRWNKMPTSRYIEGQGPFIKTNNRCQKQLQETNKLGHSVKQ